MQLLLLALMALPAWGAPYADFVRGQELPAPDSLPVREWEELRLPPDQWADPATRPRLRQLFEHYVYGYAPEIPALTATTVSRQRMRFADGVEADLWDVDVVPALPNGSGKPWRLSLFLPAKDGKHPLLLTLNKCGNHTVVDHEKVPARNLGFQLEACADAEFSPKEHQHFWNVSYVVSRGWGFATIHESDIAPDSPPLMRTRAMASYDVAPYNGEHGWGALAAWGWGLRTLASHLYSHPSVRPDRVVLTGHSRRGKAALLASAFDERIAGVVPHQSGFLGMAPARRTPARYERHLWDRLKAWLMSLFRENIMLMRRQFPHWLAPVTKRFEWREGRLPVDQHLLLAMVAPRPLLGTEGLSDYWANYAGSLANLRMAMQQRQDIPPGAFSQIRVDTGHTMTKAYWPLILNFLDRQFPPPSP